MRNLLILLHPYCPFVTEELWAHFKPKGADMLLKQSWPEQFDAKLVFVVVFPPACLKAAYPAVREYVTAVAVDDWQL